MKVLKVVGWILVPYVMIFVFWKQLNKPLKVLGSVWAFLAAFIVIAQFGAGESKAPLAASTNTPSASASASVAVTPSPSTSPSPSSTLSPTPTPNPTVTPSPTPSTTATATPTPQATVKLSVDEDTAYLKAIDNITYNTFVEASNIGDQLKQLGASKIKISDFSDFMDTDASLWGMYIKDIEPTTPKDAFLVRTRLNILTDLNNLKAKATNIKADAAVSDLNKILSDSRDLTATLNLIKQHYSEAVSKMKDRGIDANWTPDMVMP